MKNYFFTKLISSILILALILVVLFYAVTFVNIEQWSRPHPISENFKPATEALKGYIKMVFTDKSWGHTIGREWVEPLVKASIPITLRINAIAFTVYIILGFSLGYISGKYHKSFLGRSISNIAVFFGSIPPFISVMLLIILLGYQIPIAPPQWQMIYGNFDKYFLVYLIPIIALSLLPMSNIIRNVSAEYKENRTSNYYEYCVAKGLKERYIYKKHVFKNILVAILPELKNIIILVVTNSFFVERIYNIPGVSYLLYDALISPFGEGYFIQVDINVAMPVIGFYVVMALGLSLIIDFIYPFLDPRMKFGLRKTELL